MIGEGHDGCEAKIFDLPSFQAQRARGTQRRRPVGASEINGRARSRPLIVADNLGTARNVTQIARQEPKAFLGMHCVSVQGYSGCKTVYRGSVLPKEVNVVVPHDRPPRTSL